MFGSGGELEDLRKAREMMAELKKMLEEVKPYVQQQQAHTVKGEKTPNEVFAKIYRTIADATERQSKIIPQDAMPPEMAQTQSINRQMAEAYEANDEMAIALAQAAQVGASYMFMVQMVESMYEMFDHMLKEIEGLGDQGPGLWSPGMD